MKKWFRLAIRPDIRARGIRVALIVGTVLAAINQGDIILHGTVTPTVISKILLTYCVPYCVSTYASVEAVINPNQ